MPSLLDLHISNMRDESLILTKVEFMIQVDGRVAFWATDPNTSGQRITIDPWYDTTRSIVLADLEFRSQYGAKPNKHEVLDTLGKHTWAISALLNYGVRATNALRFPIRCER